MPEQVPFEDFFCSLRKTIISLSDITNFKKIDKQIGKRTKSRLKRLNTILNSENIEKEVNDIFAKKLKTFHVLPLLLAIRKKSEPYYVDERLELSDDELNLEKRIETPEGVMDILNKTGILNFYKNKGIANLHDYIYGVEVGLDSNARKNRYGKLLKEYVCQEFRKYNIQYMEKFSLDILDDLNFENGDIADLMVESNGIKYLIKTNFYSTAGSTQTKKAELYTEKASKLKGLMEHGIQFVWITDGEGWKNSDAKEKLKQAYDALEGWIYNIRTLASLIELLTNT